MTGYEDNWRVRTGGTYIDGVYHRISRHKGEFPNCVLFSFVNIHGIFMDFQS